MEASSVVLFPPDKVRKVLSDFDFRVADRPFKDGTRKIVVDKQGREVCCPSCQQPVTENHVGTVAKGSRLVFCDNPICFSSWIAQNKI